MIAGRLTMRAAIERNQATGSDAWNAPAAPVFVSIGEPVACFIWSEKSAELVDGGKNAETETYRALFALAAPILPRDVITTVTNRAGVEVLPGRIEVMGPVQRKHTHLECNLRRIS